MYCEYFKIREYPFSITPNPDYYCELAGHQEGLNVILISLKSGEGFIKIIGEVGTGKTLLCRLLLENLDDGFKMAYIHNPDLSPIGLKQAIAKEFGVDISSDTNQQELLDLITQKLLALHIQKKQVVILVDEAQALSEENLEVIRLLTNLETSTTKLLQVVLFGQPELEAKLNKPSLRQLKQRITFSYYLKPISKRDLGAYLCHRLAKAGYTQGNLFTPRACRLLYKYSQGLPRLINILSHKAMMFAYGRGERKISAKAIRAAIKDSEAAQLSDVKNLIWLLLSAIIIVMLTMLFLKLNGTV